MLSFDGDEENLIESVISILDAGREKFIYQEINLKSDLHHLLSADCRLDGFIDCHRKPPFIVFRKHETPAVIGRCFAPSTIVMPDFSKNRLIGGQPHFKKQDSFSEDVDFFTFA